MKTTFKNIFLNLIHIEFTIFCFQMSILALEDKAKAMKELKKIRKEPLTAVMGFLCDIGLEEAKKNVKIY